MATILSGVVTVATAGEQTQFTKTPTPIRALRVESDDGNSNPVFIGGLDVSATAYGIRLASAGNDSGWIKFEGQVAGDLSDFWADVTTPGEKVQFLAITAL